jgi:predicted nucleic acid-binding protein
MKEGSMNLVVDTSVIIAVITNEEHKRQLINLSKGVDLIAPPSLHWEIGNAFSAMFKRKRISLEQALAALVAYQQIPIQVSEVELEIALELSSRLNIYAYDSYVIGCALKHKSPLITLDNNLLEAANRAGAVIKEVNL